jgi:hypothetical protein
MSEPALQSSQDGPPGEKDSQPAPRPWAGNGLRTLASLAVLFTLGNALWAAWDQGQTYDEFYHLEWPRRLLFDRIDERESSLRFDSKTPALLPAVLLVRGLEAQGVNSERILRFASRLVPVFYLAVCLGLVAALARSYRSDAAWLAVLLVALDPNMAANASIATTDVAYACAVLVFALAILRGTGTLAHDALVGCALGLAFVAKFTAVLLVPVAVLHVLLERQASWRHLLFRLTVLTGACCLTASGLYLFVGVGAPLASLPWRTPLLQSLANLLPSFPVPFPRSILTGIDISRDHDQHLLWNCYLFGQIHQGGVWYYFLAHWLMKTPVALIGALAIGLAAIGRGWRNRPVTLLAALFALHLLYFSFLFSTQIGFRYVLMCVPLASVLAAWGLARYGPIRPAWLVALAVVVFAERIPYWGDPIAFTNVSVWPKSRAYWYTADSSLDYGQNRERVARYVKESGLSVVTDQATVTPGTYVVNANGLTKAGNFKANKWLLDRDIPAVRFGFTDFGFSITGERFDEFMNEARVAPSLSSFDESCSGNLPHYPPGAQLPFVQEQHPDGGRLWIVCVRSRKGVDLGLTVKTGRLLFGRVMGDGSCSTDFLQANQAAWVRVPRGASAELCIREIPFRRPSLPYLLDAYLTVRGQGADVDVRRIPDTSLQTLFGQEVARAELPGQSQ